MTRGALLRLGCVELTLLSVLGWWAGARFPFPGLAIFGAAFGVYLLAAWRVGEAAVTTDHRRDIWLLAIAMRVALLPLVPELSDDVYRYLWDGHVWLSGTNPYLFAPAAAELVGLRTSWHHLINNPTIPTIYPPVAQAAFLVGALAGSSLVGLKVAWLICDLATGLLIGRIARATGRNEVRALLLYLWAPLLIVEVAWSGHLEPLGMLAMTAAMLFAVKAAGSADARFSARIATATGIALALSALTKFAPAAALPALARRFGWRPMVAFAFTGLLLYLPFASAGQGLFTGLQTYGETWWFMKGAFVLFEAAAGDPVRARQAVALVVFFVVGWTAVARFDLERALLWTLGAGMILTPTLHPWYVLWMLPMAALRTSRPWILLNGLAFIGYFGLGSYQQTGEWIQPDLARAALWIPFFLVLLADTIRATRPPRGETAVRENG